MPRRSLAIVLILFAAFAVCACASAKSQSGTQAGKHHPKPKPKPSPTPPAGQQALLAAGNGQFAGRILKLLGSTQGQIALSPFSISDDLAMVDAGARGQTAQQIGTALDFGVTQSKLPATFGALAHEVAGVDSPGATLDLANRLFAQQGTSFQPAFTTALSSDYGAPLQPVDFAGDAAGALQTINGFVSQQTQGLIPSLLSPADVTAATTLVLVNAIYLDAKWVEPFEASDTHDAAFTTPAGSAQVSTMHQTGSFLYAAHPGYRVLEMPYQGGRLAMDVLLPSAGTGALAGLEQGLAKTGVPAALTGLKRTRAAVSLPKFDLDTHFELKDPLSTLGMPIAFSSGADFSGIASGAPLAISAVVHEAHITVDEAGTKAAAATGTVVAPTAVASPVGEIMFNVNRPFVFVLRDRKTDAILFEGAVTDPSS